jgi:hypothetical protein
MLLVLLISGCGIGAGVVALHGATMKHATFHQLANCRDEIVGTTSMGQYVSHTETVCDTVGPGEHVTYNPNHLHFGALLGLKEGYASASYSTGAGMTTDATSHHGIEPYFDINVGFSRYGAMLEAGYAYHSLDDTTSFGAVPISLLGMVRLGPITTFGGVSLLTHSGLSAKQDVDLGGYRLSGGLKVHAFSVFSDQIDVYPRAEVIATRASGDNGASYDGTAVDLTLELGF